MGRHEREHLRLIEPKPIAGRVPPHDLDAEAAVLSAVMLEPGVVLRVLAILRPDDFYSDANRRVFEAAEDLAKNELPIDSVAVGSWLRERDWLNQVGGSGYLAQLVDATPSVTPTHVEQYARTVARLARRRRLVALCQTIAAEGYGEVEETWEQTIPVRIEAIATPPGDDTRRSMRDAVREAGALVAQMQTHTDGPLGIRSPSAELNDIMGGFQDAEVTLVGGRRGGGKTAFMSQIAIACARGMSTEPWCGDTCQLAAAKAHGITVDLAHPPESVPVWHGSLIFSLEMPRAQLTLRMQCTHGRVDFSRMKTKTMRAADWRRFHAAGKSFEPLYIDIDEEPNLRIAQLRARVARVRDEYALLGVRLRFVGLDYVQYASTEGLLLKETGANRERLVSEFGRQAKTIAKHKDNRRITWMLLTQLNKDGTARESSALEMHVDNILELRVKRDANPAGANDPPTARRAEIVVTKQRNGKDFRVANTWFHEAYVLYDDAEHIEEEFFD